MHWNFAIAAVRSPSIAQSLSRGKPLLLTLWNFRFELNPLRFSDERIVFMILELREAKNRQSTSTSRELPLGPSFPLS
jgi:hypothetical protein